MRTEQGLEETARALDGKLADLDLPGRLRHVTALGGDIVFTTSLGIEDQVLTAAIADQNAPIRIVTLQTGRLFAETIALIDETRERYGVEIIEYQPEQGDTDAYVAHYGLNGFYDSVEARKACCGFRKVKPLNRAVRNADVWITGLRREQSQNRSGTAFAEVDREHRLIKVNPLADWKKVDIDLYVTVHDVPVNPLHGRGYPSIGCAPCTRAIKPGEPERAGRWWWENSDQRECGLHVEGLVARAG